jgi:tetratricopeptide (TPR) repeat protein
VLTAEEPAPVITAEQLANQADEQRAMPAPITGEDRIYRPRLEDVRPSSFQEVTPGRTQVAQMRQLLGDPVDQRRKDQRSVYTYRIGPFEKVEIAVVEELVSSVTLYLDRPTPLPQIVAELGLDVFSPVTVEDEVGNRLGLSYPERGVTLSTLDDQRRVARIVLDPILPEPFVLRAEQDRGRRYREQLADLDFAIATHASAARPHGLKAERLSSLGRLDEALTEIEVAIRLDPEHSAYRVTRARLLFEQLAYTEAVQELEDLLDDEAIPPEVRARAECCLGDMLATGPHQDAERAMQHHMKVIKLATPLGTDRRVRLRREAKRVLIDAYLGAARNVAAGNWRRKESTIPKWLESAQKLAEGMRLHDAGDETLRFHVLSKSIAAYAELAGDVDVDAPIDVAVQEAKRLMAETSDPLYRIRLRREMGHLLFDAALYEMVRSPADVARERANAAIAVWDELHSAGDTTLRDESLMGRLYFYVGSTYAVHGQDHHEAARWYERALPHLNRTAPTMPSQESAYHGERLVSMGVSYWQVEAESEAIKLTEAGLEMMQAAAHHEILEPRALSVPYGNLASMYEAQGDAEKARKMAVLASKVQHTSTH